jgi:hypothetical protein
VPSDSHAEIADWITRGVTPVEERPRSLAAVPGGRLSAGDIV